MNLINFHSSFLKWELLKIAYRKKYKLFITLKRFINMALLTGAVVGSSILPAQAESQPLEIGKVLLLQLIVAILIKPLSGIGKLAIKLT